MFKRVARNIDLRVVYVVIGCVAMQASISSSQPRVLFLKTALLTNSVQDLQGVIEECSAQRQR